MKRYMVSAVVLLAAYSSVGQTNIPAADAAKHVGEKTTVCDRVFGGRFLEKANGQPTLINMGDAYPNNPFTFVIFGDDRKKFKYLPEEFLIDKQVCVTGEIKTFKDKPQIIVTDTAQVVVK